MLKKIAALLLVPVLLAGCSAAGDVETLLRAPQLSGESAALQKALNNYLGGSATLSIPPAAISFRRLRSVTGTETAQTRPPSSTPPTRPAPTSGWPCSSRRGRAAGASAAWWRA